MLHTFLTLPIWLSTLLVVLPLALFAAATPWCIRKYVPQEKLRQNHEVAGFIYAALGLMYGVVLGFVVLFVFEDITRARNYIESEAGQIVDLYRISYAYPEPFKSDVRSKVKTYAALIVDREWPSMMYGGESEQVENQLRRIWHKFMVFSPSTPGLQLAQQAALVHLANMADSRRLRLLCAKKALPGIMWFVLLTGAVITLFFCFLFGAPNLRAQSMMSALLTIMISLTLLLILRMDHIFVGSHGLKPEAFQFSIEHMNRLLPEEKAQSR